MKNKRNLAITFMFLSFCFNLKSQNMELGLLGGVGVTPLYGDYSLNNEPKIGYAIGINFKYIKDKLSFGTNVLYERKGDMYQIDVTTPSDPDNSIGTADVSRNFNYLTIPILIGYRFGSQRKIGVNLGPYSSFLISQNTVTEFNSEKSELDDSQSWQNYDFGITSSIDYQIGITDYLNLSIEGRYNIGITDILQVENTDWTFKNQSLLFLVGINYLIK